MKKNKKNLNKFNLFKILPFLVILAAALFLASSFYFLGNKIQGKNNYIKASKLSPTSQEISSESSRLTTKKTVPSPTTLSYSNATPRAQPNSGYCLRVPVLVYHHIQPEAEAKQLGQTSLTVDNGLFDQQMAYLAGSGYTTLWAPDLINALRSHTGLPPKSILITMDDGYADNDTYALPVLKKYNIKANLMLATGLVGSNPDMLTWNQVADMKNSGLYYFTNHTWSHYAITNGPQSKIDSEIDTAASQIKQYTGQDVNTFTYPYGSVNANAIQTLQRKGYIGGFSTIPGQYQCDSFIMTLHRIRIGNAPLSAYGL
ncbi:MAG: polysaccharide deacetylase family protein [Patescibacteria group bacterium]|nr:polysaccharide deacetylase family protein [Patescibacteria group bacterium]